MDEHELLKMELHEIVLIGAQELFIVQAEQHLEMDREVATNLWEEIVAHHPDRLHQFQMEAIRMMLVVVPHVWIKALDSVRIYLENQQKEVFTIDEITAAINVAVDKLRLSGKL